MAEIVQADATMFAAAVPDLAEVLADAVEDGAPVGFVLPFTVADAAAWWRGEVAGSVADGGALLWLARTPEGVVGTVQLHLTRTYTNGLHRAEVAKLLVHRKARGQGLGRRLLATAEAAAAERGITALMLDTMTGSPAETLYATAGWTRYGVMPDHSADAFGVLQPTTFFYKLL
ncbi:GNAT family N-acetyltransferase [Hamadaea tsunoensis]|uniref:GNAT family N-acetyltransferase n=1 Tax=Hamadaea tsunoensis TaxID=53368 RepID=UPI000553440E|nr:GNAT family N-acetyltransferase [Hamadaea tsunoensis]